MPAAVPIRTRELAALFGVTPKAVREAAREGRIAAMRLGPRGHYLFAPHVVDELLGGADAPGRGSRPAEPSSRSPAEERRRGPNPPPEEAR